MAANLVDVQFAAVGQTTSAKSTVGVQPSLHVALKWLETCVSFNSGTSTDTPGKVELGMCTFATNAPGTNSSAITVANGKRDTATDAPQFTAAANWTLEPTVITVLRTLYEPQYNGAYHYINPLSSPYILRGSASSTGGVVRVTAGNGTPSASGHITVEE